MRESGRDVPRLRGTWRRLLRELSAFGTVGLASFFLDLGLFQLLYAHVGTDAVTARLLSGLVAMTAAYLGHRYWSFSHRARTGVRREYLLFAVVNGATLLLSLAAVWLVRYPLDQQQAWVLQLTNVVSIGLGTVIRYLCYRRWVFVAHDHPAAADARTRVPTAADPVA